jgi:alkylation response protein AidB-like acyl-CoA dehydrogenase
MVNIKRQPFGSPAVPGIENMQSNTRFPDEHAKTTLQGIGRDRTNGQARNYGGYGYTTEFEVERDLRDAVGGALYSGTSDIQRVIIARWLGL